MFQRILLPIDGSDLALQAAKAGIELAQSESAEVVGLFVTTPYSVPYVYPGEIPLAFPSKTEYEKAVRREAEACLRKLADTAVAAGVTWTQAIVSSISAAPAIIAVAKKQKCDLIVIGSHGRGGFGQLLLGSVTSKVLSSCHVPVLVYRGKAPKSTAKTRAKAK